MASRISIYGNGKILTMDPGDRIVESVAVADGRIVGVGAADLAGIGAAGEAEHIDLRGRTMLPGFIEPHGHFPDSGMNALYRADLSCPPLGACRTLADVIERLAERVSTTPPGEWIFGSRFDQTAIAERRFPTRDELDRVSSAHPIWVAHISGHAGAGNTAALAFRGVDSGTPDPEGGRFERDPETGELTGAIVGIPAMGPLGDTDFGITSERFHAAYRAAAREYLSQGVTLAQNAWASQALLALFAEVDAAGDCGMDLTVLPAGELEPRLSRDGYAARWPKGGRIRLGPRKVFADGAFQVQSAYLSRPYHRPAGGDPNHRGFPAMSAAEMNQRVLGLHAAGFQIHIHTNGDAAVDYVLDAVEAALEAKPRADHRHTLIHCQTIRDDQLERMAALGVGASLFPAHVYFWGDMHRDVFLGPERAARISPACSALDRGVRFTIHNDAPVTQTRPLHLAWCAFRRRTASGQILGEAQRIAPLQALRAQTIDAAWQVFRDHERGSIEVGKRADFAILSGDPLGDPEGLKDIAVEETIVGGLSAFRRA